MRNQRPDEPPRHSFMQKRPTAQELAPVDDAIVDIASIAPKEIENLAESQAIIENAADNPLQMIPPQPSQLAPARVSFLEK